MIKRSTGGLQQSPTLDFHLKRSTGGIQQASNIDVPETGEGSAALEDAMGSEDVVMTPVQHSLAQIKNAERIIEMNREMRSLSEQMIARVNEAAVALDARKRADEEYVDGENTFKRAGEARKTTLQAVRRPLDAIYAGN